MIRINDRFSIDRDNYGWNLYETRMGEDGNTGQPKLQTRKTFPGKLTVTLSRIIDACGEDAQDVAELRTIILTTIEDFRKATKSQ